MVWGAVAGLAGSVIGGIMQNKAESRARRANERNVSRAMGVLDTGRSEYERAVLRARPHLEQMLDTIRQTRAQAIASTSPIALQGYRMALDAHRQATAGLDQRLASRGLANTTAAGNFQRGLSGDLARNLGAVDAAVAGLRTGIIGQTGSQLAAGQGQLASFEEGAGYRTAGFYRDQANLLSDVQYRAPQGVAAGYGALGAQLGSVWDDWRQWRRGHGSGGMSVPSGGGAF